MSQANPPPPGSPTNPRQSLAWVSQLQTVHTETVGTRPKVSSQKGFPNELLAQGGAWAEALAISGGEGSANLNYLFPNLNRMLPPGNLGMFEAATVNLRLVSSRRAAGAISTLVLGSAYRSYAEGDVATLAMNGRLPFSLAPGRLARIWRLELRVFGYYVRSSSRREQIEARLLVIEADLPVTASLPRNGP